MTSEANVSLAPHTSLRVGGPADFFLMAGSAIEVAQGLSWAHDRGIDVHVIGGGSNLLVADEGVDGLVIKTAFSRTAVEDRDGQLVLVADAGATLANQARRLAKQSLGGLEWAANVPGTIGGAVVNNAGAFGGETAACLVSVTLVDADGHTTRLRPTDLGYAYRTSRLKTHELGDVAVASAEWRLRESAPGEAEDAVRIFNSARMQTQPRILSAGSVFANPEGAFSGQLIEAAGLKGIWEGGAQISEQHANFIVNPGNATARDVFTLMRQAQDAVYAQTGIWLRAEIELLGRWSDEDRWSLQASHTVANG